VRQRALEDGETVFMAVPGLAGPEPFSALDPDHLRDPLRKAASISGAARSAHRVTLAGLSPVDLVVMGCVAAAEDGAGWARVTGSPTWNSRWPPRRD
jgi:5-formyltetrahydrofolate cyclo-ligase